MRHHLQAFDSGLLGEGALHIIGAALAKGLINSTADIIPSGARVSERAACGTTHNLHKAHRCAMQYTRDVASVVNKSHGTQAYMSCTRASVALQVCVDAHHPFGSQGGRASCVRYNMQLHKANKHAMKRRVATFPSPGGLWGTYNFLGSQGVLPVPGNAAQGGRAGI